MEKKEKVRFERELSEDFLRDLEDEALLKPLINIVKADDTLCLNIRHEENGDFINIYYRGGSILKLINKDGCYRASFNSEYIQSSEATDIYEELSKLKKIQTRSDIEKWIRAFPLFKREMDIKITDRKKERESQQLILRENNASTTDYYICDIEYSRPPHGRFDMIAVKWPTRNRATNDNLRLAIIEVKYGIDQYTGTSGIIEHIEKTKNFLTDAINVSSLKKEMKTLFNQLHSLGLVKGLKYPIGQFSDEKPEYILILVNHQPTCQKLRPILEKLNETDYPFEIKIAMSNFMGYGLYKESIVSLPDFLAMFRKQIYCRDSNERNEN